MPREKLIHEPLKLSIPVHYPELTERIDDEASEGGRIRAFISDIVGLDPTFPLLVSGRAHGVSPGSPAGGDSGSYCNLRPDGGCNGRIVLAPRDRGNRRSRISFAVKLVKGRGDQGWFTLTSNPTTILAGDNVHPASLPDPDTGQIVGWPSSSLANIRQLHRLGFNVLQSLFQQMTGSDQRLFDPATWERIEEGAMHIVNTQFAAYLRSPDRSETLQGLTVLFGQTIVTGKGIINLAKLQGLEFEKPYVDPHTNRVETVTAIKMQGKRPSSSMTFYDKDARSRDMRQRKGLPDAKAATVDQNVRLDITLHSLGVKATVRQGRMRLKRMMIENDPALAVLAAQFSFEEFLAGEAPSTVRALECAIVILSVTPRQGQLARWSFADWLVPYVLQDLLRLDVITKFTVEGYEAFLKCQDPIAVAWRTAVPADIDRWAEALAKRANVTVQTVYNRERAWLKEYRITIALPNAYYRDALYFGASSVSRPKDRSATLAAQSGRDGNELLRLRDKAALRFDRLRREVVGAMIRAPLHVMNVEVATTPVIASTAALASGIARLASPTRVGTGAIQVSPPDIPAPRGMPLTSDARAPALKSAGPGNASSISKPPRIMTDDRPRPTSRGQKALAWPELDDLDDLLNLDDVDLNEAVPSSAKSIPLRVEQGPAKDFGKFADFEQKGVASPEPDDFDNLPFLDAEEVDLPGAAPTTRAVSTRPIAAPSSKPSPPRVTQEPLWKLTSRELARYVWRQAVAEVRHSHPPAKQSSRLPTPR